MNFNINKELLDKLKKAQQVGKIATSSNPVEALTDFMVSNAKEKDKNAQVSNK